MNSTAHSSSGLKAVILAAGQGKRMKSDLPKVLFEANGLPLLWYVVRAARESGVAETVAVVGVGRDLVEERFRNDSLKFVVQAEQRGTGHAVRCARQALAGYEGYAFILCGDAPLIRPETLKRLYDHTVATGASGTILTSIVDDPAGYGRIMRGPRGVCCIVEERDASPEQRAVKEINSGTYCFRWPDLDAVLDELSDQNDQGELLLTDAISLLIGRGRKVEALVSESPEEALGVNSRSQLAAVAKALRIRVLERLMAAGVTVVDPDSAFIDERAEIGRDTTINPFVVIEGAVKVGASCVIGPFTHIRGAADIRDGVTLGNFVEVVRSTVGVGSRAKHHAFVADATVGSDVNVAAGVITANWNGKAVSATEIGDGASIGAGTVIVAPAKIDAGGATGAGAVVTAGRTVPSGETWVGVPARRLEKSER